jgi:hypothetical protein
MSELIMIELTTENAAFVDKPATEIARILRELADDMERDGGPGNTPLRDINGEECGSVSICPICY